MVMSYIVIALLVCLGLFCFGVCILTKRKEPEPDNIDCDDLCAATDCGDLSLPDDISDMGESCIFDIVPDKVALPVAASIGTEGPIAQNYDLLFSMHAKLMDYLIDNDIDIPNEFLAFQPLEFGSAESYPFVKPELISVSPSLTNNEDSMETIKDQHVLAKNEFMLKNMDGRIAFPSDLIKRLRLKPDEKVWTIVHNNSLKLGKGNIPYSKFEEGRSYKTDATGQIKVGEKVFNELDLNLDSLMANIKRGVITVMEI